MTKVGSGGPAGMMGPGGPQQPGVVGGPPGMGMAPPVGMNPMMQRAPYQGGGYPQMHRPPMQPMGHVSDMEVIFFNYVQITFFFIAK